jgi:hypothetical protein
MGEHENYMNDVITYRPKTCENYTNDVITYKPDASPLTARLHTSQQPYMLHTDTTSPYTTPTATVQDCIRTPHSAFTLTCYR